MDQTEAFAMTAATEEAKNSYKEVVTVYNVLVKVPKKMKFIDAHVFLCGTTEVPMDCHFKHGMMLESKYNFHEKIIINQKFFGIEDADLGKVIVAQVNVEEKMTRDARRFTQINIIKNARHSRATKKMAIEKIPSPRAIQIAQTDYYLRFDPLV